MSRGLVVVLCISITLGAGVASAAAPYYLTVLNPTGVDTQSWANGMALANGAPEAVGTSGGPNNDYSIWEPVSWNSSGAVTNLLPLIPGATAGAHNQAYGIDSDGDIVGQTLVSGAPSAFYIPSGGSGVVLPTLNPSSPSACANGVSDSGLVVGYSTATDGSAHAFVWSPTGGMIDLGTAGVSSTATAISADGNTIIGDIGPAGQAVEWTRSGSSWTMTTLISRSVLNQSLPHAINSSGDIVGIAFMPSVNGMPPSPSQVAFEWQPGGTVINFGNSIPGVNGPGIGANGINDSGVIVGDTSNEDGAFVNYTGSPTGNISLQSLMTPAAAAAWSLGDANAIDNKGDITGLMWNNVSQNYAGYFLTPAIPGDANLDGKVDINDLTVVLAHYNQAGMTWSQGDFTGSGTVDINDLTIVLAHYNQSAGASDGAVTAVPEPATLCLLGAGAMAVLASSWRRRRVTH